MQLIRGLYNLRPENRGCVLSIGNFDGLHLGHQALLKLLCQQAGSYRLAPVCSVSNHCRTNISIRSTASRAAAD